MPTSPPTEPTPPATGSKAGRPPKPTERFHGFVSLQSRGSINLPTELRKRFNLDTPGAQLELTEREDGVLEVRPMLPVPAADAWFWTPQWQAKEAEVDAALKRGEGVVSASVDDFLSDMREVDRQATEREQAQAEGERG